MKDLVFLDFFGYLIGGLFVGELKDVMNCVLEYMILLLLVNKLCYLMGVGLFDLLIDGVIWGVDMFDCVFFICIVWNGICMIFSGCLVIKNVKFIYDFCLIDENCDCYICKNYLCVYIWYLICCEEIFGIWFIIYYNFYFLLNLMK